MSSIIEALARTAVEAAPGMTQDPAKVEAQKRRGLDLIKGTTTGGVLAGAGVGLSVALVNYLKAIKDEELARDPNRLNDDNLYMPAPDLGKEASSVEAWTAPGLAVLGGVAGAGVSYAVVKAIAERLERNRRQALLDKAQQETLLAADEEARKSAANMTVSDMVTAIPVAIPLLAALSAAGISYAGLNKAFPTIKRKKLDGPKKIKFVDRDGQVVEEEDVEKVASEMLLLTVDAVAAEKCASHCITSDLLDFVAQHGKDAAEMMLDDSDTLSFVDHIAGSPKCHGMQKVAAARDIQDSPTLSAIANVMAASEFADMLPNMFNKAASFEDDKLEHITNIAVLMHLDDTRDMSKVANVLLDRQLEDRDAGLSSDANGSASEDFESTAANDAATAGDDAVDTIMGDIKTSPIAPQ